MKRFFSVFLSLILCICVAFPVNASELDNFTPFANLLDYATANNSGSNYFAFSGSTFFTYDLPGGQDVNYIDITFHISGPAPIGIHIWSGSDFTSLVLLKVSDGYYRAYGSLPVSFMEATGIQLDTGNASTSWVTITSLRVGLLGASVIDQDAYCDILTHMYSATIHYVPGDEINGRNFNGTDDVRLSYLQLDIRPVDWQKYDYMDFLIFISCDSINSVAAYFGSQNIPFTCTPFENDVMTSNEYILAIRLDLRAIDRSKSGFPNIVIEGNVVLDGLNQVEFLACSGCIIEHKENKYTFWLTQIYTSIETRFLQLFDIVRGDTQPGEDFQDDINQKDDQLKDMSLIMDSVPKPEISSVDFNANQFVDPQILSVSTQGLSSVMGSPIFSDVIIMAVLLATAGFVLFGKR